MLYLEYLNYLSDAIIPPKRGEIIILFYLGIDKLTHRCVYICAEATIDARIKVAM